MDPNTITLAFVQYAQTVSSKIEPYTLDLLFIIGAIDFVYMAINATRATPIEDLINQVVTFALKFGIFYAVIIHADSWLGGVIASFSKMGANISGVPNLDPMTILNTGTKMADTIMGAPTGASFIASIAIAITQIFAAGWILVCFALVGILANFLVVEAWFLLAGGKILLAFGPGRWTSALSEGYLSYVVGCGMSLLFMFLLLGMGNHLAVKFDADLMAVCKPVTSTLPWYTMTGSTMTVTSCEAPLPVKMLVTLMVDSLILLALCAGLPMKAGRLVNNAMIGGGAAHLLESLAIGGLMARSVAKLIPGGKGSGAKSAAGSQASAGGSQSAIAGSIRPSGIGSGNGNGAKPMPPTQPLNPAGPNAQTQAGYYGQTVALPSKPPAPPTTALGAGAAVTTKI